MNLSEKIKQEKEREEQNKFKMSNLSDFSTEDLSLILYEEKLKALEPISNATNLLNMYSLNKETSPAIIEDIKTLSKKYNFLELKEFIDEGYDEKYLIFLKELKSKTVDVFRFLDGYIEKGELTTSLRYHIDNDFNIFYGFDFRLNDLINKVLILNNSLYKHLSINEANFLNSLKFKEGEKILMIGADLGYMSYILDGNYDLSIYEEFEELYNVLDDTIYKNLKTKVKRERNKDFDKYDRIIISPSLKENEVYKYYYNLGLHKYNVENPFIPLIINKFKIDLRDVIMFDISDVVDSIIDVYKEMDGKNSDYLSVQLGFSNRAYDYLKENNLFFDNYKAYKKFVKKDENIFKILDFKKD